MEAIKSQTNALEPLIWDIIEKIFGNLEPSDLKVARLVCRQWNDFIKRGELYLDWQCSCWRDPAKKFIKTLKSQPEDVNAAEWKSLRLKNGSIPQFERLMNDLSPSLIMSTFDHVKTLELKDCTIPLTLFFQFLSRSFPSLKDLSISFVNFPPISGTDEALTSWTLPTLEKLVILKKYKDANSGAILRGLNLCHLPSVKELEFNLVPGGDNDDQDDPTWDDFELLGSLVHKLWESLQILRLDWKGSLYITDLNVAPIFQWPEDSTPQLTEIHISLDEIPLRYSWRLFQSIHHCSIISLKRLSIKKIILNPYYASIIPCLPSVISEFGILVTDDPSFHRGKRSIDDFKGEARAAKKALRNNVLQRSIVKLWVYMGGVTELKVLLPIGDGEAQRSSIVEGEIANSKVIFVECRELVIFRYESEFSSGTFTSFNLECVVTSFPGITALELHDGPQFDYKPFGRVKRPGKDQWAKMSEASMGDKEIQVILGGLPALKSIKIGADMRGLTDFGLTGRSGSQNAAQGVPISSLRGIEQVVLKGLGPKVTDVTAQYAFKGCQKLREVTLYGDTSFSWKAKDKLRRSLPHPALCQIQLI